MKILYMAWQDPDHRKWYPIARLRSLGDRYEFAYTNGAQVAALEAGFQPLAPFPELQTTYVSQTLFPIFLNRLLPHSRPEYNNYLEWLSVPKDERDPFAILARSGGRRVTDTLEVFPCPERDESCRYTVHFLVHGTSHMTVDASHRAMQLQPGERLLAMHDCQNPKDPEAIALRTNEIREQDMYLIGYCPRYLKGDFQKLLKTLDDDSLEITVVRVNPPPAPIQFRVLCRALMKGPPNFRPFDGPELDLLVSEHAKQRSLVLLPPRS